MNFWSENKVLGLVSSIGERYFGSKIILLSLCKILGWNASRFISGHHREIMGSRFLAEKGQRPSLGHQSKFLTKKKSGVKLDHKIKILIFFFSRVRFGYFTKF